MFSRGYRGSRSRSGRPRPVIQSFKKVLNILPASFTAGFQSIFLVQGVDSVAVGQLSNTDAQVPTGAMVKFIEIQFCVANLVAVACYINCTIQLRHSGQTAQDPDTIGGNKQRNQVFHQDLYTVGLNQNSTHKFKFKIPKKFQRVREGDDWLLTWKNSASVNQSAQIIYKFYR